MGSMSRERAERFRPHIESKLKEKGVRRGDHAADIAALSPCVLATGLIRAYNAMNGLSNEL